MLNIFWNNNIELGNFDWRGVSSRPFWALLILTHYPALLFDLVAKYFGDTERVLNNYSKLLMHNKLAIASMFWVLINFYTTMSELVVKIVYGQRPWRVLFDSCKKETSDTDCMLGWNEQGRRNISHRINLWESWRLRTN